MALANTAFGMKLEAITLLPTTASGLVYYQLPDSWKE